MRQFRAALEAFRNPTRWFAFLLVAIAVTVAYANHFHNEFHFDDFHTITDNAAIRSLHNLPRFFTDANTFSMLPSHASYRPLVSASLAIDYWIGSSFKTLSFHVSTFCWFLVLLALFYALAERIFEGNRPLALFAAALFGLHPASAETVNYIIQRADLYATLGVVAGVLTYAAFPKYRRWGLYLVPALAGMLAKPSALVFAPILFAYIVLFERGPEQSFLSSARRSIPAFSLSIGYWFFQKAMTPATFSGASSVPFQYWITQPFVSLRYFRSFFAPFYLSADSDLTAFTTLSNPRVLAGIAFILILIGLALWSSLQSRWKPVAFGLIWFLLGLIPTAVVPLAEVENDHRMFLPFIGLALSLVWACHLLLSQRLPRPAMLAVAASVLIAFAWGTHQRNAVWHTEESLWHDVTLKSPQNGRGWMNYGLTQMQEGKTLDAYRYFKRATKFTPNYSLLEINLGIASGLLHHDAEAEQHFRRAIQLEPRDSQSYSYYGKWLLVHARPREAQASFDRALALNPADLVARQATQMAAAPTPNSPEDYLARSLAAYQSGRYEECVKDAAEALRLRPGYAEAYNNIAAGNQSLGRWDDAMAAAEKALNLKPGLEIARNNLSYERTQKMAQIRR